MFPRDDCRLCHPTTREDGNPHAHILLTLRAIDEHGKWLPKARKVYDLDENGERIRLASGNWKCHKENTVDWNDQKYAEVWRHGWETITNRYLEAAGRPERVDLRSFERQGIQQIPTVHLGPAAHQMEKRGVETFLGNLNRDIRAANSLMQSIRSAIRGLQRWIADLNEKEAASSGRSGEGERTHAVRPAGGLLQSPQ